MEILQRVSKNSCPLEVMVNQVKSEVCPKNFGPIWWDKLPISRFTLDKFNPLQNQHILSQELYKNRNTGTIYGRYYLQPNTTDSFIPTMVLGKPDDVIRFASRDGGDVFDLNINDGITLPNIGVSLMPDEIITLPDINTILSQGNIIYFGRKSSHILTRLQLSTGLSATLKVYENILVKERRSSFVHITNSDESPLAPNIGGLMMTNSRDYIEKVYSSKT